jgi:hypothetical protein
MSIVKNSLAGDIKRNLFWAYATIALSVWALAGFLPFFGLFVQDQTTLEVIIEAVFLSTGSLGVFGLLLAVAFMKGRRRFVDRGPRSSKAGILVSYASLWMVAYAAYVWIN